MKERINLELRLNDLYVIRAGLMMRTDALSRQANEKLPENYRMYLVRQAEESANILNAIDLEIKEATKP